MTTQEKQELEELDKKLQGAKKRKLELLDSIAETQRQVSTLDTEIHQLKKKRRLNSLGAKENEEKQRKKRETRIREILWCECEPDEGSNDRKDRQLILDDCLLHVTSLKESRGGTETSGDFGSEVTATEYTLKYTYKDQTWQATECMDDGSLTCTSHPKLDRDLEKTKPPGGWLGHFWSQRHDIACGPLEGQCACRVSLDFRDTR